MRAVLAVNLRGSMYITSHWKMCEECAPYFPASLSGQKRAGLQPPDNIKALKTSCLGEKADYSETARLVSKYPKLR